MVQRTPTYIVSNKATDPVTRFLNGCLPSWLALRINRWKYIFWQIVFYQFCMGFPEAAKRYIKGQMFKQLKGVMQREEFEKHFSPPYDPWTQRLCLSPGGDFFAAIRYGSGEVRIPDLHCNV